MRIAILSDIHANLEALQAVLAHVHSVGVDAVYCLGDVVGYGADPVACVDVVRERCVSVVLGNHDAAVAKDVDVKYLPKDGQVAALKHRELLDEESIQWLAGLPLMVRADEMTLVHATPFEPDRWHRMGGFASSRIQFDYFDTEVCFVGHTHVPGMMSDALGVFNLRRGRRYLINVGSVGQPRDNDPRAAFCLFDSMAFTHEIVRVPYDVEQAVQKIVELGMPKGLSERLREGR